MKYLWLTMKHKWFVLIAGLKIGTPLWRLIIHDWTKFLPSELPHYNRQFFGKADDPKGFAECWLKHQNRNQHHWEYWIPRTGHNRCDPPCPDNDPLEMPLWAIMEMVADWMGASRAYSGKWPSEEWPWWKENKNKVLASLHKNTVQLLLELLSEQGLLGEYNGAVCYYDSVYAEAVKGLSPRARELFDRWWHGECIETVEPNNTRDRYDANSAALFACGKGCG